METILLVLLGCLEAFSFHGDGVHNHRAAVLARLLEVARQRTQVMTVDGAGVLDAQI